MPYTSKIVEPVYALDDCLMIVCIKFTWKIKLNEVGGRNLRSFFFNQQLHGRKRDRDREIFNPFI